MSTTPAGFDPLPFGDAMRPHYTHSRACATGGREYWTATRPHELTRVEYLSNYARSETTHPIE